MTDTALSTWWIDGGRYAAARARLAAGDPALAGLAATVRREAAAAAAVAPAAVTDRGAVVPCPTDDPHAYVSVATYWWPNPDSADGAPWVRRDGEPSPAIARYDRPRWESVVRSGIALGRAAWLLADREAAADAAARLRRWFLDPETAMRPHLANAQFTPGQNTGRKYGIIDFGLTMPNLLDHVVLLRELPDSPWTTADHGALQAWCADLLHWLKTDPLGVGEEATGNNHGVFFDRFAVALALFLGRPEQAREQLQRTRGRIAPQIEADGSMPHELGRTCSFGYSQMNTGALLELAAIGRRLSVDLWSPVDGRSIAAAADFLWPYATGDADWTWEQIEAIDYRMLSLLYQSAGDLRGRPYDLTRIRDLPPDFDPDLFPLLRPIHPFGHARSETA